MRTINDSDSIFRPFCRSLPVSRRAFWAWDHLQVQAVDPSTFDLFSDPTTCAKSCASTLGLSDSEHAAMQARAKKSGMIQLAMHHAELKKKDEAAARKKHHHHKKPRGAGQKKQH